MIPIVVNNPFFKKRHKFNAKRTIRHGVSFPSRKEADYYTSLLLQMRGGLIKSFKHQVPFKLKAKSKSGREFKCIIDFQIEEIGGNMRYVDTKGYFTNESKLKIALCELFYGIRVEVV